MPAILPIPGRFKATTRLIKCSAGFGGASPRGMKGLRQIRNLRRTSNLQASVDRPRVTAGFGDQLRDAYVAELHRTARVFAALRSSM
jgi:hypothetical protein